MNYGYIDNGLLVTTVEADNLQDALSQLKAEGYEELTRNNLVII